MLLLREHELPDGKLARMLEMFVKNKK